MPNYPVTPATIPSGFCPSTWQEILNQFSLLQSVFIPASNSQLVVSATKPADTTVAWLQLDSVGHPTRIYYFAQGAWLSLHPLVPGLTQWWFDELPDFTTFDGGDNLTVFPTSITGPMWQKATRTDGTVIAAQFPIAAGTLPSGLVLNPSDVGGEEKHSLTTEEMPPHIHDIRGVTPYETKWAGNEGGAGGITTGNPSTPVEGTGPIAANEPFFKALSTGGTGDPPVVVPHGTMPPYVVGYLLQRTQRLWYAVS